MTRTMSNRSSRKLSVKTFAETRLPSQEESLNSTKQKTSRTLALIVILYIVCNTPRLLLNMMDHFFSLTSFNFCNCALDPFWFEFFVLVSHLFLVINSAVNFLIYFSVSKMFKKSLIVKMSFIGVRLRFLGDLEKTNENDEMELKHLEDSSKLSFFDPENTAVDRESESYK